MNMHKTNSHDANFAWVREPEFTPPDDKDGGMATCLLHEFTSPRAGELKVLLETFLESIIGTVHATAGVVRLLSPDGRTLQLIGSVGLSTELQIEAENFVELNCEISDIDVLGHVVHTSDISGCSSRPCCPHAKCKFQSLVAAPLDLPSDSETVLGVLTLFFDVPPYTASLSMNVIAAFAETMAATIQHTRINREATRMERLAARQVIANEIHDSLAQTMTYARMRASLLKEAIRSGNQVIANKYVHDLDEALEIGQKSVRELIADFRCEINTEGLSVALNDLTKAFQECNNIVLEYHNLLADLELPLEFEIQVYHIVQEALTNIARHSGATHARLFVDANYGYYVFTIEDNGSGDHTFAPIEGHYGMMIMRERAQQIGGKIKIESAPGLGTQVQLFFPEPPLDWRASNE